MKIKFEKRLEIVATSTTIWYFERSPALKTMTEKSIEGCGFQHFKKAL